MLFSNDVGHVLYYEIAQSIAFKIINFEYPIGSKIPSVRDLAITLNANPNTIMKALDILEKEQLITTDRTNGKYVTEKKEIIFSFKEELAKSYLDKYYSNMEKIGYTLLNAREFLKEKK